jgi:hypothetical protein
MTLRAWMLAGGAVLLAGCDYTVPLAKTPDSPIDQALVGAWSRTVEKETQRLLVLPLGTNEYLVSFPAGEKNALFARACLCKAGERTLVQLTWFGTALGTLPEDGRVYQFAAYTVKGDTLQAGLLNADIVKRDAPSAEALVKAINANIESPDVFRETMTFKKDKPPDDPNKPFKRPPIPPAWR